MITSGNIPDIDLKIQFGHLTFNSPLIAASGTFGYGVEFRGLVDFSAFGAIILKAVSVKPRSGNPYPRIAETPAGMLNSIGLENPGLKAFVDEKLPESSELGVPLIANLVGDRIDDYIHLAQVLDEQDALVALEINASCPNVDHGYETFSVDPRVTYNLVRAVRKATSKPIIAKLSPNVTDIIPIAKSAVDAGADGLDLVNTFLGMAIDVDTRKSRLGRDYAGLSGHAIRPLALRIVHQVASEIDIPIIGTGGIYDTNDALEFLIAGATAISIGTINFIQPGRASEIIDGLKKYLSKSNMSLAELTGSYHSSPHS